MVGIEFLNSYLKKPELVDYEVAGGPSFEIGAGGGDEIPGYGPEIPSHMILDSLRRRIPNFDEKRQKIRDAALRGYLRGV